MVLTVGSSLQVTKPFLKFLFCNFSIFLKIPFHKPKPIPIHGIRLIFINSFQIVLPSFPQILGHQNPFLINLPQIRTSNRIILTCFLMIYFQPIRWIFLSIDPMNVLVRKYKFVKFWSLYFLFFNCFYYLYLFYKDGWPVLL